ncbi:MAG: hypothetical protein ABSH20_27690 [Tepidisphaeraceae bacterium]
MNIAWTFLAMAAALFVGWSILRIFWPAGSHGRDLALIVIRLCLALGVGQAVAAVHYLAWRVACSQVGLLYKLADCLLIPVLAWVAANFVRRSERTGRRVDRTTDKSIYPSTDRSACPTTDEHGCPTTDKHVCPTGASASPLFIGRLSMGFLLLMTALVVSTALCICLARDCYEPLGAWDGWAIWNLKARFLFRAGSDWTAMFSRHIWFSHPDYPLLIPASVARFWTYLQAETPLAPQLLSITYTTLVVALLFASLAWLRGLVAACLAVILLVSYEPFLSYGGAQMSDIPLSFYVLAAVVVLAVAGRRSRIRGRLILLAGVLLGCALTVKNEAQAVTLSLLCAMALVAKFARRWFGVPHSGGSADSSGASALAGPEHQTDRVSGRPARALALHWVLRVSPLLLLLGALPFLLALAAQKLCFAGSSYLVADQPSTQAVLQKMLDPGRHQTILQFLLTYDVGFHLWRPFTSVPVSIALPNQPSLLLLPALPLICGLRNAPRDRRSALTGAIAIALAFVMYYAVFLVMPYELANLLESFPRVQLHLWPALILTVLLVTRVERDNTTNSL